MRLDPDFLRDPALLAVLTAVPRARVVGGAVRDALAGRPVADIDLATPDTPEEVTAALRAAGLKAVPTGLAHGTVTAVAAHRGFEITTLRRDVATDGRHATVAFTDDWQEDAARRDFTINAMSLGPDGRLFDYFGGACDLAAGRVRFVGTAAGRIAEDYLRILRFFRFHARFGHAAPDAEAIAAIRDGVPGLAILSVERVWSEVKRILAASDPDASFALMAETGVLAAILPEGATPVPLTALPADPLLRLAAVLTGDAAALAERWRLSGAERETLIALRVPLGNLVAEDDLRRLLADTPGPIAAGRAHLAGRTALASRLLAMPRPVFPLRGRDLAGLAEGPALGTLLRAVRDWWMEGGCHADREACLVRARNG